jgi:rRNA pseudouridine-1189 N-methylase Emg1 (Nep1/Mra1 family)
VFAAQRRLPVPAVEVRIAYTLLPGRMDDVRRWLSERGCVHKLTSTGSSDDRVIIVEFPSGADAEEFARHFNGQMIA